MAQTEVIELIYATREVAKAVEGLAIDIDRLVEESIKRGYDSQRALESLSSNQENIRLIIQSLDDLKRGIEDINNKLWDINITAKNPPTPPEFPMKQLPMPPEEPEVDGALVVKDGKYQLKGSVEGLGKFLKITWSILKYVLLALLTTATGGGVVALIKKLLEN